MSRNPYERSTLFFTFVIDIVVVIVFIVVVTIRHQLIIVFLNETQRCLQYYAVDIPIEVFHVTHLV